MKENCVADKSQFLCQMSQGKDSPAVQMLHLSLQGPAGLDCGNRNDLPLWDETLTLGRVRSLVSPGI